MTKKHDDQAIGIHAQSLLRVGTIGFGDAQSLYAERATRRTRKLVVVIIVHASA